MVAAENEYGSVASQIGGRYVHVTSIENNPNIDPHTYEVSPGVAAEVGSAAVVIQNGIGYDTFMNRLEAASPSRSRRVIDVQQLLHLPDSTPNPHIWYAAATMPAVAKALGNDLAAIEPGRAAYFHGNVTRFDSSLGRWHAAVASFRSEHHGVAAAVSEPVADDLLEAMGIVVKTPFRFQADVMNGNDPTPQDVALQQRLLARHQVRLFAYNVQVVNSLTVSIRADALRAGVPVVGVYETMPTPGYDYQSWMLAETEAIERAVLDKTSTTRLGPAPRR